MFKKVAISMTLVSAVVLGGCASVPMANKEEDTAAKTFATKADKANLYIYRNETMGAAVKLPVLIDGVAAGDTVAHSYILKQVAPGNHTILSKGESDSTLKVDAKAGQNYFIWQEVKMGAFSAGSALHSVDAQKGQAAVKDCELVK